MSVRDIPRARCFAYLCGRMRLSPFSASGGHDRGRDRFLDGVAMPVLANPA